MSSSRWWIGLLGGCIFVLAGGATAQAQLGGAVTGAKPGGVSANGVGFSGGFGRGLPVLPGNIVIPVPGGSNTFAALIGPYSAGLPRGPVPPNHPAAVRPPAAVPPPTAGVVGGFSGGVALPAGTSSSAATIQPSAGGPSSVGMVGGAGANRGPRLPSPVAAAKPALVEREVIVEVASDTTFAKLQASATGLNYVDARFEDIQAGQRVTLRLVKKGEANTADELTGTVIAVKAQSKQLTLKVTVPAEQTVPDANLLAQAIKIHSASRN
jgi:hypothetical protein